MDATDEVAPHAPQASPPSFSCQTSAGRFVAGNLSPFVSSGRKRVFRGELLAAGREARNAVAIEFVSPDASYYGREVAALSRCSTLGVGPAVYDVAATHVDADGAAHAVIVEEDAGASLESAVFDCASVPGIDAAPLAPLGSAAREVENEKNPQWNDFVKIQLIQDRCDLLENIQLNEEIKVYFNLRGRKWENKGQVMYFTNLEGWRIEKVQPQAEGGEIPPAPQYRMEDIPPAAEADDLPF